MKTECNEARDSAFEIATLATAIAYSDCCPAYWKKRGSIPQRNLNFCCAVALSRDEAIEITQRFVPSYNLFSPKVLLALPDDCRVRLAREGSVCVYFETASALDRTKIVKELRCDEFSLCQSVGALNVFRAWWD